MRQAKATGFQVCTFCLGMGRANFVTQPTANEGYLPPEPPTTTTIPKEKRAPVSFHLSKS